MSSVSKSFAAVVLAVALTTSSASALPTKDPGSRGDGTIVSRILKVVKHLVHVVVGDDDLSIPHP